MSEVFINWGDTSSQSIILTGNPIPINHNYIDASGYVIEMSGRTSNMTSMILSGSNITEISGFSDTRVNISSLNLNNNNLFILPIINNNLKHLYLDNSISNISSNIPNYSVSSLETLHINNNNLNNYTISSLPTTMHNFSAEDNSLSTTNVTNIINDMYNNSSSKVGMSISLRNNGVLLDTSKKYDLIDNSGSTIKVMGRFTLNVMRNTALESGRTFNVNINKPITDKNISYYNNFGDGNYSYFVLSGSSSYNNYNITNKLYPSGTTVYNVTLDGYWDDITTLKIERTYNFTASSTINLKEFSNLEYLNLPYYDQYIYPTWLYHCYWVGSLDLSRNNKIKSIICDNHRFTSLIWPNDVSNFTYISTNSNSNMVFTSPRIDLMPDLTYINMYGNKPSGILYNPNESKNLTYYDMSNCSTLSASAIPNFTDCTGLTYINLDSTNLNNNGLTDWTTLSSLTYLSLNNNYNLTGTVINLDLALKLNVLYLRSNGYNTFGNSNWNSLTGLTRLEMNYCSSLSDIMPPLTDSKDLRYLRMYNNKLYGQCIDTTNFPSLEQLEIQYNKLSKEFPDFTNNTKLRTLDISNNLYNQWGDTSEYYGINNIKIKNDKIYVGGVFSAYSGQTSNKLIKLNTDGTIDTLFDQHDTFLLGSPTYEGFNSIIIQNDDKIIAGGNFTYCSGQTQNYIVRFNNDGTIDSSFNIGTGFNNYVNTITLQSDGKILVGGSFVSYKGISNNYRIIRLDSGGTIDSSFNIGIGFNSWVNVITLQSDGKILVGGSFTTYKGISNNYIIRLDSGGTIDSSFNIGIGFNSNINTMTLQSDGKILVGGNFTSYKGIANNRIIRLDSGGTIDSSFNIGIGFNNSVNTITLQSDGKILVGGQFTSYSGITTHNIIRLDSGGTIDSSFNIGTGFNNRPNIKVNTIDVQIDGKILVGGSFTSYYGQLANRIIRLNSDGTMDNTFNIGSNRSLPDLSNNTQLQNVKFSTCGLNMYYDNFTGLTQLSTLDLTYNNFVHFPDFSKLTNLQTLYMYHNSIIDDLSGTSSLSTTIRDLRLNDNMIIGGFPIAWSGFTQLSTLYIYNNYNLTGIIPSYFSSFTNLRNFNVNNCKLEGDITPIGKVISTIDISNNLFTSGVTSLSGSTTLSTIRLYSNNFSGCTFFNISNFTSLQYLEINNCNLHGTLSPLPNSAYFYSIELQNNQFTGDIPAIPNIYYNQTYNAYNNLFTGYTSMPIGMPSRFIQTINFRDNYLNDNEINKVIADLVKQTTWQYSPSLTLTGPNMGIPYGQGTLNIDILKSKWTINVNILRVHSGDTQSVDSTFHCLDFIYDGAPSTTAIINVSGISHTISQNGSNFIWDLGGVGEYIFTGTNISRNINGSIFSITWVTGYSGNFSMKIRKS